MGRCGGLGTCTRPSVHLPPPVPPETRAAISLWPAKAKQFTLNFLPKFPLSISFLNFFPQFLLSVLTFSFRILLFQHHIQPLPLPPISPFNHQPPSDHHPRTNHRATARDLQQPPPCPYWLLAYDVEPALVRDRQGLQPL